MFTNRGSTISPTINKFNVQCVGHDNCHQLVFQVIVEVCRNDPPQKPSFGQSITMPKDSSDCHSGIFLFYEYAKV